MRINLEVPDVGTSIHITNASHTKDIRVKIQHYAFNSKYNLMVYLENEMGGGWYLFSTLAVHYKAYVSIVEIEMPDNVYDNYFGEWNKMIILGRLAARGE